MKMISSFLIVFIGLAAAFPSAASADAFCQQSASACWGYILAIANYPFLSFKEINFSLAVLLKLIVLTAFAMLFLRRARRKAAAMLVQKTSIVPGAAASITTLGYYAASVAAFFIILGAIGINLTELAVIFGALGIGIGFGLQTIMNNFISGIILLVEQVVRIGDIVHLGNGITGEVKRIAIRFTVIKTMNGDDVIVPNSELVSGRVNSWTYSDDWRRLTVPFGVTCGADPDEVVRLTAEAARAVKITKEDEAHQVQVFFEGFSPASLTFSLRVWCRMRELRSDTGLSSDYYFALHQKMTDAGIKLFFP